MISTRRERLAYKYLPHYDAEFLIRAYHNLEDNLDASYDERQLIKILFDALDNALEGHTYDSDDD